jgi:hypothetical protein
MTARKKIVPQTRLSDEVPGFRIGPNGEVEVLTKAEVDALIARTLREAIEAGLPIRRFEQTLH